MLQTIPAQTFLIVTAIEALFRAPRDIERRERERRVMGKNEKTGLGRALVKQHNQMIQQSKEKGGLYRKQNKKVLESFTEISDIEAIVEKSDSDADADAGADAVSLLSFNFPPPSIPITLSVLFQSVFLFFFLGLIFIFSSWMLICLFFWWNFFSRKLRLFL